MRIIAILAFCLFAGLAVAELGPLLEDWRKPVPEEVVPVELKPEPVRPYVPTGRNWMGG